MDFLLAPQANSPSSKENPKTNSTTSSTTSTDKSSSSTSSSSKSKSTTYEDAGENDDEPGNSWKGAGIFFICLSILLIIVLIVDIYIGFKTSPCTCPDDDSTSS